MATVYVAGEVVNPRSPLWTRRGLRKVYQQIEEYFKYYGFEVELPYPDTDLDSLGAQEFNEEIEQRIERAELVVSVMGFYSPSAAVESTIASFYEKIQAILIPPGKKAPRMLAGLPFVQAVGTYDEVYETLNQLRGDRGPDDSGGGVRRPPRRPRPEPIRQPQAH
jgi:hypothetical protein